MFFCCDYGRSQGSENMVAFESDQDLRTFGESPGGEREVAATLHEVLLVLGEEDGCIQEWGFHQLCQAIEGDRWDLARYKEVWSCLAVGNDRLKGTLLRIWFDHNYCADGKNPTEVLRRLNASREAFKEARAKRDAKRSSGVAAAQAAVLKEHQMEQLNKATKEAPWFNESDRTGRRRAELRKVFHTLDPHIADNTVLSSKQVAMLFGALIPKEHPLQQKLSRRSLVSHTLKSFLDLYQPQMEAMHDQEWDRYQLAFKRAVLEVKRTPRGGASAPVPPSAYQGSPSKPRIEPESPARSRSEKEYVNRLVQLRTFFRFFDVENTEKLALKDIQQIGSQMEHWLDPAALAQHAPDAKLNMEQFLELHQSALQSCSEAEWQANLAKLKKAAIGVRRKSPRSRSRSNSPSSRTQPSSSQPGSQPNQPGNRRGPSASPSPLQFMGR